MDVPEEVLGGGRRDVDPRLLHELVVGDPDQPVGIHAEGDMRLSQYYVTGIPNMTSFVAVTLVADARTADVTTSWYIGK